MAVLLHALFALVLVDFGFTAFLDGAHGGCVRGWYAVNGSGDDFVERILDDSLSPQAFQFRDDVAHDDFVNHRLHGQPSFFGQAGNGGTTERGKFFQKFGQARARI